MTVVGQRALFPDDEQCFQDGHKQLGDEPWLVSTRITQIRPDQNAADGHILLPP